MIRIYIGFIEPYYCDSIEQCGQLLRQLARPAKLTFVEQTEQSCKLRRPVYNEILQIVAENETIEELLYWLNQRNLLY